MFKNWFKSDKDHPAFSVLVVSDDGDTLALIRTSLTEEGCEVYSAVSAEAGVQLLDEIELPDVIIGDFYYPERDGKHFLNKARIRFGKSALPPTIFLMDSEEDETAAYELSVNDVLEKPFEAAKLLASLTKLIERPSKVD